MADWSKPTILSTYINYTSEILARDVSNATWFDSATVNDTVIPNGAKRWNSTNLNWEKYNGGAWTSLSTIYNISISGFAGGVSYNNISNLPTSISGYGILDAYTKVEIDASLPFKADKASPAFTGTPTAPTPATSDNTTKLATTAYVQNQGYLTKDSAQLGPTSLSLSGSKGNKYFWDSVILSDGTIRQWGYNGNNNLATGNLNTTAEHVPTRLMDNWNWLNTYNVKKLVSGDFYEYILFEDGKVAFSGHTGISGLHGLNTSSPVGTAIQYVIGIGYFYTNNIIITDIVALSHFNYDCTYRNNTDQSEQYWASLFLSNTGEVYALGYTKNLAAAGWTRYITPTKLTNIPIGITKIYNGAGAHISPSFAYSSTTNKLYVWGRNYTGNSGVSTAVAGAGLLLTEVTTLPLSTAKIVKIHTEADYYSNAYTSYGGTTYVLLDNGEVWATGANYYGQLGDGTTTQSNVFKKVPVVSGVTDIQCSGGYSTNIVALNKNTGVAWAWGFGASHLTTSIASGGVALTNVLTPTVVSGNWKSVFGKTCTFGTTWSYFLINTSNQPYFAGYNASNMAGLYTAAVQWIGLHPVTLPQMDKDEYVTEMEISLAYHITASYGSSRMLTNKRRLFKIGNNNNGELGIGYSPNTTHTGWKEVKF